MKIITLLPLLVGILIVCVGVAPARAQSGSQSAPSQDQLDQLLAPIALYPDALVAQILQCATSPYQVKQVNQWLQQNPDLKGTDAQAAAQKQGFDASFIAIVIFPDVLKMLADKPDWTQQLGQAFTTDRDAVMATVQRLRKEAKEAGNLKSTQQQSVETVSAGGQQVIVIEPTNPQVVYVPQYNPEVVYTEPASSSGDAVAAGIIGFAAGVIVGAAADNDDDHYYYACGGWGYARPICYPGGYNNYYDHRENMANDYYKHRENMHNDYYDHRENMVGERGDNQQARRDDWSQGQQNRQQTRDDTRSNVQDQRGQNQSNRQDTWSQGQESRGDARSSRQDQRGQNQSTRQDSWQSRGGTTSRGAYQGANQRTTNRSGMNSGAFSGYQRGSTERASSARGHRSMGSRSGGRSRGGGRRR